MPAPIVAAALTYALAPMFLAVIRAVMGVGVGYMTYSMLDSTVRPYIEDIFVALVGTAQEIQGVGALGSLLSYFEFVKIVQLIVSAYAASFSIRIARLSFTAFSAESS